MKNLSLVLINLAIILLICLFIFKPWKQAISFPNDADGATLKRIYDDGVDFKKPQLVDFCIAVPNEESGNKILKLIQDKDFINCHVDQDEPSKEWTLYVQRKMLLVYKDIIEIQDNLDSISKPYGGYSDGWGVLVDPKKK